MKVSYVRRCVPLLINAGTMGVCLFVSAGRTGWPNAWALMGVSFLTGLAAEMAVVRTPGLAAERRNVGAGRDWDKALVAVTVLLGPVATWIAAGWQTRQAGPASLPATAFGAGLVMSAAGGALLVWAMRVNAYFSSVVRIQTERGHGVISDGPYRFVRHPGYCGMSLFMLATPLILRSSWAILPAVATVAVTTLRTALEDRTLRAELNGYADYASRVGYKLLPWVW